MERFSAKVLGRLGERGESQARAARAIGVDPSQFGKWLKGKGRPTVEQLLALGKHLGLSLDYLADDEMAVPPKPAGEGLTDDQRSILEIVELLRLTRREALDRLLGPPKFDQDSLRRADEYAAESERAERDERARRSSN